MKYIKKGSFTVEAALVLPVILMTIIAIMYLSFFLHDRAVIKASADELSLALSQEYIMKGQQGDKNEMMTSKINDRLLFMEITSIVPQYTDHMFLGMVEVKVEISSKVKVPFVFLKGLFIESHVNRGTVKVIDARRFIHISDAMRQDR